MSQGVFGMPFPTHELAWSMLRGCHTPAEWDHFTHIADVPTFIRPTAYVQKVSYADLQDGMH